LQFAFAFFWRVSRHRPRNVRAGPRRRRKSPSCRRIDNEALKHLITEQRERPLLINFWATWCDPCRDEFPDLVKIDSEYRPQSLEFVTVSLDT
jgi:thiol-disulfide isomerase/thioredoxin